MTVDEYLEALAELSMSTHRGDDIAHFLVGFLASKVTGKDRSNAIEQVRKIYVSKGNPS